MNIQHQTTFANFDRDAMQAAVARFHERVMQPRLYGSNDCCVAIADTLAPVWGVDLMQLFRGRYRTQIGFLRVLRREGFDSLLDAINGVATSAGAIALDQQAKKSPQDFDLGYGLVDQGIENSNHDETYIVSVPAFYWQGFWQAMTYNGIAVVSDVASAWRFNKECL